MIEFEPLKIAELIGPLVAFVVGMGQIGMIGWGIATDAPCLGAS